MLAKCLIFPNSAKTENKNKKQNFIFILNLINLLYIITNHQLLLFITVNSHLNGEIFGISKLSMKIKFHSKLSKMFESKNDHQIKSKLKKKLKIKSNVKNDVANRMIRRVSFRFGVNWCYSWQIWFSSKWVLWHKWWFSWSSLIFRVFCSA